MDKEYSHQKRWHSTIRRLIPDHQHYPSERGSVLERFHIYEHLSSTKVSLGPYANEKRMPQWLVKVLEKGDQVTTKDVLDCDGNKTSMTLKIVETPGLIPVLARLSNSTSSTSRASYCSPLVHHVAKLRREGSFCGYRNIQMMVSYVRNAKAPGHQHFDQSPLPSIFTLQKMIETAWENGYNTSSRADVGQLHLTRKFIGTSEVEALFLDLEVPVSTKAFVSSSKARAFEQLVDHVSEYFALSNNECSEAKVTITQKPPIYLQRSGHSMTIVGIEENTQGLRSLIVFDPKYQPDSALKKMAIGATSTHRPEKILETHRYGAPELAKFVAFEVIQLDGHVIGSK